MTIVSCQSKGNMFATVEKQHDGQFRVVIKVFAHWCKHHLDFIVCKFDQEDWAIGFVDRQLNSYGGKP